MAAEECKRKNYVQCILGYPNLVYLKLFQLATAHMQLINFKMAAIMPIGVFTIMWYAGSHTL